MFRTHLVAVALATALVALASSPVSLAQPAQVQAYDGAAKIGNLDQVTVVYPAAEGLKGQIYRDSALLRASWLHLRYGVEAVVATDEGLTEAQRMGHLLVLGWDNKLITEPWFTQVAPRQDGVMRFLGAAGSPAVEDLLWMHTSPYNPESYLVFWSRIDPDRDRLLPFPFIGSDWAWWRDYFMHSQGMFNDEVIEWPPAREPAAERMRSYDPLPLVTRRGHFAVYHKPGVLDEAGLAEVLQIREAALKLAAELLAVTIPDGFEINLHIYATQESKHELSGVFDVVHSLPSRSAVFMTLAQARLPNAQEEIHLLAGRLWGLAYAAGMYHGLSIHLQADPGEQGAFAALMIEQDIVPQVADLYADEELRVLARAGYGFPAAALLVEWIYHRGGTEAMSRAYGLLRENAAAELAGVLKLEDEAAVDAAFHAYIVQRAAGAQDDLAYRRAIDEARQRGQVGDLPGEIAALERALELRPQEVDLEYRIALVHLEGGEMEAARERLTKLVALEGSPEPTWVPIFSRYKLAGLMAEMGDLVEARRLYQEVLAGPDEHDAHKRTTDALAALDED